MGNILCRDKTPRRVYVKGPIKGTDKVFDPQLFSNDSLVNGTRKDTPNQSSNNNKMFFSTPNLNNDMKSTISLDARIFDTGSNKNPPIAPPRKKRTTLKKGSTLPPTMPSDTVRNGFKDVFGNTSISSSNIDDIDFIDKEDNSLHERPITDQRTSTPEKKLHIGNRKSDKFFGESLSDHLSDEPVSDDSIPLRKKESTEVETEMEDSKTISDKKLSFFLMNMLDDIRNAEDEEKYKGQEPVDEPPFIAKKKITKHICDDDDHIHDHIHKRDDVAPPKPDRDFSKFRASPEKDLHDEIIEAPEKVEVVQAKVIVKRGISRENLPSPPATPHRKKGVTSPPNTPTITIETIDASIERATIQESNDNHDEVSQELVDEVVKKAYGMSDFNYHPEDFSHATHEDGSDLVMPTSKLAVRKISTPRKVSTESAPSIDGETMMVKTNDLSVPTTPYKKSSFCENEIKLNQMMEESHAKFYEIDEAARIPSPLPGKVTSDNLLAGSTMNDMINEIYSRNSDIMKEFQSFLEQSIEKEPVIDADEEKRFLEAKKSLEQYAPDPVKDTHEDDFDNRSYSDSFESTDNEDEIDKINNEPQQPSSSPTKRRESIENVDNWFSHHIEMEQNESDVCNSRGSEQRPSVGYDTNKIFPFGSTIMGRRDSQSDEFFNDTSAIMHRIKAHIEAVQDTESIITEENEEKEDVPEKEQRSRSRSKESSPDHSTLLKFLDKNNPNESTSNK